MHAKELCFSDWPRLAALATALAIALGCLLLPARLDAESVARIAKPADLCRKAAKKAARRTGVPYSVLLAISLTETGRSRKGAFEPWPWTVNMEGAGHWFDGPAAALAYARKEYARGARSFDLGCFQVNYKWHGGAFSSLAAMIAPDANALYAARYLATLYREKGDWNAAAGAYHSRSPKLAARYSGRFARILATIAGPPGKPGSTGKSGSQPAGAPPHNGYPLMVARDAGSATSGSLMPLLAGSGTVPLLIAPADRLF